MSIFERLLSNPDRHVPWSYLLHLLIIENFLSAHSKSEWNHGHPPVKTTTLPETVALTKLESTKVFIDAQSVMLKHPFYLPVS